MMPKNIWNRHARRAVDEARLAARILPPFSKFSVRSEIVRMNDMASADKLANATVVEGRCAQMHAYPDAIEPARSAWVLYPGTELVPFSRSLQSRPEWSRARRSATPSGGGRWRSTTPDRANAALRCVTAFVSRSSARLPP